MTIEAPWIHSRSEQFDTRHGRSWLGNEVHYVSKNTVSTGPFVVSINPINANTFAVAALGNNGHCYAEISHTYGSGGQYGWTRYAKFPRGVRCAGLSATIATVTEGNEPQ